VAIGLSTFYRALAEGPMSTAASVTAMVGSLIPVAFGLALGDVPGRLTLIGIGLAVPAGVAVSVGGLARAIRRGDLGPRSRVGQRARRARTRRLSLLAGSGFGFFFVSLAQTSPDGGLHPLLGARFGAIVTLVVILTVRPGRVADRPGIAWADGFAVFLAGLLDCSANSFYLLALDDGSLTWVAAIVSLYPVATVLLARVVLAERIARVQAVGLAGAAGALVLVGVGAG
jgi:drug/metabolite transporter (DMT)-like permease